MKTQDISRGFDYRELRKDTGGYRHGGESTCRETRVGGRSETRFFDLLPVGISKGVAVAGVCSISFCSSLQLSSSLIYSATPATIVLIGFA
jgi:hypothetical protein